MGEAKRNEEARALSAPRPVRSIVTLTGSSKGRPVFMVVAFCSDGTMWQAAPVPKGGEIRFCIPSAIVDNPEDWQEGWTEITGKSAIPGIAMQ